MPKPADRIRQARKAKGLTQEQLARKAAVSKSLVSMIENGSRPATDDALIALANALGVDPQFLRYGSSPPPWWDDAEAQVRERLSEILPRQAAPDALLKLARRSDHLTRLSSSSVPVFSPEYQALAEALTLVDAYVDAPPEARAIVRWLLDESLHSPLSPADWRQIADCLESLAVA